MLKKKYFYMAMKEKLNKSGFVFKTYEAPYQSPFDKLFEIFKELITYTLSLIHI